nr:YqaJ viral recombinase family protein [Bifidobacterium catenulatum]
MKRIPLKDTERYTVERFKQHTAEEREAAWLKSRSHGVGGSDMSTILGLNKYASPYDLWLEKTKRVKPKDISDNWAIVRGKTMELELRRRFKAQHPEMIVTNGTDMQFISREKPYLRASLDGILQREDGSFGILEIKTAGNRRSGDWHDEDGNLRIPPYYLAQVEFYCWVTGWTWGYVYAAIGDYEPVEIPFRADQEDMAAIDKAATDFWQFVTSGTPPQLTGGDVQKAFPEPTPDIVDESSDDDLYDLLAKLEGTGNQLKDLKAEQKALQDQVIVRIGSHTGIRCGNLQATYKTRTRKEYVVKATQYRQFALKTIEDKEQ